MSHSRHIKATKSREELPYGVAGVPLLVTVRDFANKKNTDPDLTLLDYIYHQVRLLLGRSPPIGFVEFWLSKKNSLTIFDGLDEVTSADERKLILELILDLAKNFVEGKFIVMSRIVGYEEASLDRNSFLHLLVIDLEWPQIRKYVRDWYTEREPIPSDREEAIVSLLEAFKDVHVADLARNPLLLTIMVLVHRAEADLPKQRALLYSRCVEAFMVTRDRARDLLSYDEFEIRACHEYLGYWIHIKAESTQGSSEITLDELKKILLAEMEKKPRDFDVSPEKKIEEFIEYARRRVGLIVEKGPGLFAFGHRSFQEYFVAQYIFQSTFGIDELWSEVHDKIESPHWVEPLKLLAGIYGFANRQGLTKFVERILQEAKISDPSYKKLILAGEIAGDKVPLDRPTLVQIANAIIDPFLKAKNANVMNSCKMVLEHFYGTRLWNYMVSKLRSIDPSLYTDSAFYYFYISKQFGDTRIDKILATL